jgi:hypothetical protein
MSPPLTGDCGNSFKIMHNRISFFLDTLLFYFYIIVLHCGSYGSFTFSFLLFLPETELSALNFNRKP